MTRLTRVAHFDVCELQLPAKFGALHVCTSDLPGHKTVRMQ